MPPTVTPVTVEIRTDWGKFKLLSTGAAIAAASGFPYPPDARLSEKELFFGTQGGDRFQHVTLRVYIHNDGTPVDFVTSHGDGSDEGPRAGKVSVVFAGNTYLNDHFSGDGLNGKVFIQAPVGVTKLTDKTRKPILT